MSEDKLQIGEVYHTIKGNNFGLVQIYWTDCGSKDSNWMVTENFYELG